MGTISPSCEAIKDNLSVSGVYSDFCDEPNFSIIELWVPERFENYYNANRSMKLDISFCVKYDGFEKLLYSKLGSTFL